jgi:hypothetical protein
VRFESVLLIAFWFLRNSRVRMDEITNYFTIGQTSGFVEGNKVKVLRRRCYEITSLTRRFNCLSSILKVVASSGYEAQDVGRTT